jgi:hypothetical protein
MQIKFRSGIVPAQSAIGNANKPMDDVPARDAKNVRFSDHRSLSSKSHGKDRDKTSRGRDVGGWGSSSKRSSKSNEIRTPELHTSKQKSSNRSSTSTSHRRKYEEQMKRHSAFKPPPNDRASAERSRRSKISSSGRNASKRSRNKHEVDDSDDDGAAKKSRHEKPGRFETEEKEERARRRPPEFQEVVMDGKRLRLKKFDPQMMMKIAKNPSVASVAKRGSGKSVALRHIMRSYGYIPGGIVMSRSERLNNDFKTFFRDLFIYEDYDSEAVKKLLERQEMIKEKNAKRIARGKRPIDTRVWVIMDDCLASKASWAKDEGLLEIMMNGRHYDIFYILTMQYPLGIGPELRTNFDFILLFGENFANIRRKIYDHYCGVFPTYNAFERIFTKVTANFGCMVLNNREKSIHLEDLVYWWRADPSEAKAFVGSRSFNKYHEVWYDKEYRKRAKAGNDGYFDTDCLLGKKRQATAFDIDLADADDPPPRSRKSKGSGTGGKAAKIGTKSIRVEIAHEAASGGSSGRHSRDSKHSNNSKRSRVSSASDSDSDSDSGSSCSSE